MELEPTPTLTGGFSGVRVIMDLSKVLSELRQELERLDAAIVSLERLKEEGRRRGRPPKALSEAKPSSDNEESEENTVPPQ